MPALFKRKPASQGPSSVSGAAYGLTISFEAPDAQTLDRMRVALPPTWEDGVSAGTELKFSLVTDDRVSYRILLNDQV